MPQGVDPVRCLHWRSMGNEAAAASELRVYTNDTADSMISVTPCWAGLQDGSWSPPQLLSDSPCANGTSSYVAVAAESLNTSLDKIVSGYITFLIVFSPDLSLNAFYYWPLTEIKAAPVIIFIAVGHMTVYDVELVDCRDEPPKSCKELQCSSASRSFFSSPFWFNKPQTVFVWLNQTDRQVS